MAFTKIVGAGINSTTNVTVGVITATGGIKGIGIYSGGSAVHTGVITSLNFIGTGNTITVHNNRVDIGISGGISGIGIGLTLTNPQSGSITNRVGTGFTDINFVGTGLSVTGYGSTVVVEISTQPKSYYNYFEVSGLSTSYGEFYHKYIESSDNDNIDLSSIDQMSSFMSSNLITPSIDSDGNLIVVI